jgi:hypothetical protein
MHAVSPRGGFARGQRPRRPGDLTGRQHNKDLAVKRIKEDPVHVLEARDAAYLDGWNAGYDAGAEAVLKQLRDAGLDLDAQDDADDPEDAA